MVVSQKFDMLCISSAPLPKLPQSGLYPRLPDGSGRWSPPFRLYVYSWLPAINTLVVTRCLSGSTVFSGCDCSSLFQNSSCTGVADRG